jgi:hypothetical protein
MTLLIYGAIGVFGLILASVGFAAARVVIRPLASMLADIARATETSASEPALLFGAHVRCRTPAFLDFLA